jgi:hypothetical protein
VAQLLASLEGDPAVLHALREGSINQAQCKVLNSIGDEIGRSQGLTYCQNGGMTARYLAIWAEQRRLGGVDVATAAVLPALAAQFTVDYRTHVKCIIHNDFVSIEQAIPRAICEQCWQLVEEAMDEWAERRKEPVPDSIA